MITTDRHADAATVCIYRLGTHANARLVLHLKRYAFRVFANAGITNALTHSILLDPHLWIWLPSRTVLRC